MLLLQSGFEYQGFFLTLLHASLVFGKKKVLPCELCQSSVKITVVKWQLWQS
jgi:hypothetical protein